MEQCQTALTVFTVRPYTQNDLKQLIGVYQSAFAEKPWDEYRKCVSCGVNYGIEESVEAGKSCKKCSKPLNLVEFWSETEIIKDLELALSQRDPIILVGEDKSQLVGFTWGYRLPIEKFPFLKGKVLQNCSYMDEIAVRGNLRKNGLGQALGKAYLERAQSQNMDQVVLRTDERNEASMALFKKLGFWGFKQPRLYDPQYPNRLYLAKFLGEPYDIAPCR